MSCNYPGVHRGCGPVARKQGFTGAKRPIEVKATPNKKQKTANNKPGKAADHFQPQWQAQVLSPAAAKLKARINKEHADEPVLVWTKYENKEINAIDWSALYKLPKCEWLANVGCYRYYHLMNRVPEEDKRGIGGERCLTARDFDIPAGSVIDTYDGAVCLTSELSSFIGDDYISDWNRYGYTFSYQVDGHDLCLSAVDDSMDFGSQTKFINDAHGLSNTENNSRFVEVVHQGWPELFVVTAKKVSAREEITVDYGDAYFA